MERLWCGRFWSWAAVSRCSKCVMNRGQMWGKSHKMFLAVRLSTNSSVFFFLSEMDWNHFSLNSNDGFSSTNKMQTENSRFIHKLFTGRREMKHDVNWASSYPGEIFPSFTPGFHDFPVSEMDAKSSKLSNNQRWFFRISADCDVINEVYTDQA